MKVKVTGLLLFLAGLIVLQQVIAFGNQRIEVLEMQSAVIKDRDIDPSALFYTESRLALAAEKQMRHKISAAPAAPR
jgi:hypothetical protein